MPELPEVETMVRGIRNAAEGRIIAALNKCRCRRKPLAMSPGWPTLKKRVTGRRIDEVTRRAKRVIFVLDSGDRLVIEPRMTGLMLLSDPPSTAHLRLNWRFDDDGELWYWDRRGLGTVSLYTPRQYEEKVETKLGPEALGMRADDWRPICASSRRAIKVLLLDQAKVAGVGNMYASELLHRAGVHPERPAASLTHDEVAAVSDACADVLAEAIEYEGSTLSDGTYRNALNKSGGYQNEHRVYDKAATPCPACGDAEIVRIVQAQRSTFFCPNCQT